MILRLESLTTKAESKKRSALFTESQSSTESTQREHEKEDKNNDLWIGMIGASHSNLFPVVISQRRNWNRLISLTGLLFFFPRMPLMALACFLSRAEIQPGARNRDGFFIGIVFYPSNISLILFWEKKLEFQQSVI